MPIDIYKRNILGGRPRWSRGCLFAPHCGAQP
jgi:hypothetical protein